MRDIINTERRIKYSAETGALDYRKGHAVRKVKSNRRLNQQQNYFKKDGDKSRHIPKLYAEYILKRKLFISALNRDKEGSLPNDVFTAKEWKILFLRRKTN